MADTYAWAIINMGGHILTATLAPRRGAAIRLMVGPESGVSKRWRIWREHYGCHAERVLVSRTATLPKRREG